MFQLVIPGDEIWDEENGCFYYLSNQIIRLEHSLSSLYEWESKWHKPFLSKQGMNYEETIDYIRCMTLDENVSEEVYASLTDKQIKEIEEYIDNPMTATTFSKDKNQKPNRDIVTAELIYYWMISAQIPFECQYWHLNKLMTLIRVCSIKNEPPKKMDKRESLRQRSALNAARRAQMNTKG